MHENLKPFKCDYCDKSFRQSYDLKKHLKLIHEKVILKIEENEINYENSKEIPLNEIKVDQEMTKFS